MGQSAEELSEQIAQTRNKMSSDLDDLTDKVSPSAIAGRQKDAAAARVRGVKDKVMGAGSGTGQHAKDAKDSLAGTAGDAVGGAQDRYQGSPLAAGIAAFGLGMVVAGLIPASRAESRAATQVVDKAKEQAQPLVQDAKAAAADVGDSLKQSATDAAAQVKDTATDAAANVKEQGQDSADTVRAEAPTS